MENIAPPATAATVLNLKKQKRKRTGRKPAINLNNPQNIDTVVGAGGYSNDNRQYMHHITIPPHYQTQKRNTYYWYKSKQTKSGTGPLAATDGIETLSKKYKGKSVFHSYYEPLAQNSMESLNSMAHTSNDKTKKWVFKEPFYQRTGAYFSSAQNFTKYVAIDCEMVAGLGKGPKFNRISIVGRISIVDENLKCIYDKFVKPWTKVINYGTKISGLRKSDLDNGEDFYQVQKEVASIMINRIVVGHALSHDFQVLYLLHPHNLKRDTSLYAPFREYSKVKGGSPSLKVLAKEFLGLEIQNGEHDSEIDARVTMKLYKKFADEWEHRLIIDKKYQEHASTYLKHEDVWLDKVNISRAECRYYERVAKRDKKNASLLKNPVTKTLKSAAKSIPTHFKESDDVIESDLSLRSFETNLSIASQMAENEDLSLRSFETNVSIGSQTTKNETTYLSDGGMSCDSKLTVNSSSALSNTSISLIDDRVNLSQLSKGHINGEKHIGNVAFKETDIVSMLMKFGGNGDAPPKVIAKDSIVTDISGKETDAVEKELKKEDAKVGYDTVSSFVFGTKMRMEDAIFNIERSLKYIDEIERHASMDRDIYDLKKMTESLVGLANQLNDKIAKLHK